MQNAFAMHVGKPFRDTTRDAEMGSVGTNRLRLEKLLQAEKEKYWNEKSDRDTMRKAILAAEDAGYIEKSYWESK